MSATVAADYEITEWCEICNELHRGECPQREEAITERIATAVAAERERCAEIADWVSRERMADARTAQWVAEKIRVSA